MIFIEKQKYRFKKPYKEKDAFIVMPTALVIDKKGSIKEITLKTFDESELYKKAGFKNNDGFACATEWDVEVGDKTYSISLYGKTNGRAGQENKYDFPPPVDNVLFFGSCILINRSTDSDKVTKIESLTKEEWKVIYDSLFGEFEDLGSEDSEDEDDEDDDLSRTKSGYVKDDFIVDDDEVEEEEDEEEEEDDDEDEDEVEEIKPKKVQKKKPKVAKIAKDKKKPTVFDRIESEDPSTFLDCTSELEEEEYV